MKIKYLVVFGAWFCSMRTGYSFAAEKMDCVKAQNTLSLTIGKHAGDGPTFSGLRWNDAGDDSAYKEFETILKKSDKCKDLKNYYRIDSGDAFLCAGEFFLTKGIYGQIILSEGAVAVFKDQLAKDAGWVCTL